MVVMVVEDSTTMRALVCHALRRIDGVVLVEAGDGRDALAKLDEITPDLVVTDINMPNMDGFALIKELRGRPKYATLPVVVLTTAGAALDQERGKELGVKAYATKPVRPDEIVNAVRFALGLS